REHDRRFLGDAAGRLRRLALASAAVPDLARASFVWPLPLDCHLLGFRARTPDARDLADLVHLVPLPDDPRLATCERQPDLLTGLRSNLLPPAQQLGSR